MSMIYQHTTFQELNIIGASGAHASQVRSFAQVSYWLQGIEKHVNYSDCGNKTGSPLQPIKCSQQKG
jgi:hypothetical protein